MPTLGRSNRDPKNELSQYQIELERRLRHILRNIDITSIILGLSGSRLVATNGSGELTSVSTIANWIAGTTNQIVVTNDLDGTVTLSLPQSINTDADIEFDSIILGDLTASRLTYADGTKKIQSVTDLTSWIAGTSGISVVSDGDGTVTISQGDLTKVTADSITLGAGTSTSSLSDLQTGQDGNFYHIDEATGSPGINLIVDFVNVTSFKRVNILGCYAGSSTHGVAVQLYNWTDTAWDTFCSFQDAYCDVSTGGGYIVESKDFDVYDDTDYIGTGGDDGEVRVRIFHTPSGDATHDLDLDVVALYS